MRPFDALSDFASPIIHAPIVRSATTARCLLAVGRQLRFTRGSSRSSMTHRGRHAPPHDALGASLGSHEPRSPLPKVGEEMDPTLQAKLAELVERMLTETEPPSNTEAPALRRNLLEMRDALDSLRLSVKYLAFDLEATRRENTMLRKELERKRG